MQPFVARLPVSVTHVVSTAKTMVDASVQTPPLSTSVTSTGTCKQSAAELSQPDAEEKKESPVAWQQPLEDTHEFSRVVV
jgi:hypothetical protein